jgi:pyrophosphatase PpaX
MKYEAVVFDLDGTIADTIPLTIFALKEAVRLIEGKELMDDEVLKEFGPVDTDIVKAFVQKEKHSDAQELYVKIFQDYFNDYVKPIPGISELLEFLNFNGVKVGLFTGRGMRMTKIVIDKLGINDYFKTVVSGELTKKPKPDPEGIKIALKNLGVNSSQNIYVGDFDVDILASKAAGTLSVLALWSSTGSDKLIELKPDKFFKTPYEFIAWLK